MSNIIYRKTKRKFTEMMMMGQKNKKRKTKRKT